MHLCILFPLFSHDNELISFFFLGISSYVSHYLRKTKVFASLHHCHHLVSMETYWVLLGLPDKREGRSIRPQHQVHFHVIVGKVEANHLLRWHSTARHKGVSEEINSL